jgi:hypothetical protein
MLPTNLKNCLPNQQKNRPLAKKLAPSEHLRLLLLTFSMVIDAIWLGKPVELASSIFKEIKLFA